MKKRLLSPSASGGFLAICFLLLASHLAQSRGQQVPELSKKAATRQDGTTQVPGEPGGGTPAPNTVALLNEKIRRLTAENDALRKENADLKAKLAALKGETSPSQSATSKGGEREP